MMIRAIPSGIARIFRFFFGGMELKKFVFPGWLFAAAAVIFDEVLIHIWLTEGFSVGTFFQVLFFAAGLGGLMAFLVSFLPAKAQKGTAAALALLMMVLCLTEYFVEDAYMVFMPLAGILDGAGGVMSDFGDVVVQLLLRDWWRILVLLLPIGAYLLVTEPKLAVRKTRGILAAATAVCYLLAVGVVHLAGVDAAKLGKNYNFDSAVRAFGVGAAVTLDLVRDESGDQEAGFEILETEPSTEAMETQATEGETTVATEPVVYGLNVMDVDFAALAESEKSSSIASIHKYVASLTPTSQNPYTGLFKGKNLIFITAEAFSAEVIDPVRTPTLYRLANEGIKFTDYYQPLWGGSTSTGEFSNLTGLVASNASKSIREALQQDLFLTIGKQLQALDYFSAAYHNHSHTYYDRHETHPQLGYSTFMGMGNGMEEGVTKQWPQSDLEMMEFTVDQYIDHQPFSVYYMSVSGHCGYTTAGNAMARKNFDEIKALMKGQEVSDTLTGYYASQQELEHALTYLVQRLEDAGIADDTVIVLGTDHYPYALEQGSTWGNTKNYLKELYGYKYENHMQRDHNALIIWSGSIEDMDIVVDDPVYSLDILPTLSNLFGVTYDSRLLVGRDVFSEAEPLVLWPDFNWKTDKGCYMNGKFTPNEGVEVDADYVERISKIVQNKITYSRSVAKQDYFDYLAAYHKPLA